MPDKHQQLSLRRPRIVTLRRCPSCHYERGVVGGVFVDHPDRNTLTVDKSGKTNGKLCEMSGKVAASVCVTVDGNHEGKTRKRTTGYSTHTR